MFISKIAIAAKMATVKWSPSTLIVAVAAAMPEIPGGGDIPGAGFISDHTDHLAVLALGGVAGSMMMALWSPAPDWRRRISSGLGDTLAGMLFGAVIASGLIQWGLGEFWSFLAGGSLMGALGPTGFRAVRARVLGPHGKEADK